MLLTTGKMPLYNGKGPNPARYCIGDHAPPKSPFRYFPWMPQLAMTLDTKWFYQDYRLGYNANMFTVTTVGAGSSVAQTADMGLLFTNDAADNDLTQLQLLHNFTPAANAFAAYYCRVQVSDATQHDFYFGASSADTSIVASAPANYAMFKKDDGDTILNGASNDAGGSPSETANLLTDWTAATDYDLGLVLVSTSTTVGTMYFQWKLATATSWNQVVKTSDFPDAAVRFTLLSQNGEAVAKTMTVKRWAYAAYAGG